MLVHRWLAIGTCLLFVAWFVSGLVMLYVSFPELRPSERLAALERIDWRTVRVSPDDAMRIAGLAEYPRELCLTMMAGEPVWRIRTMHAGALSVSAVDGRVIDHVSAESAQAIARAFSRTERIQLEELVSVDQWTVAGTF
ncbi:MAG TPA: hypothetical protein VJ011_01370, partial [Steroidobacteraceae bacterium]|nr:hypothetical protein [Steroidobacteraceae bacterium]